MMHPRPLGLLVLLTLLYANAPAHAQESTEPPAPAAPPVQAAPPESPAPAPRPAFEEMVAVLGTVVRGAAGASVGRLVDVLVDGAGEPMAAVLDFGGFLGVGNRRVLVNWKNLRFAPGDKDRAITLDLTADQIKAAPDYKGSTSPAQVPAPTAPTASSPAPGTPAAPAPALAPAPEASAQAAAPPENPPPPASPPAGAGK
jgi:predicted lipid-binding transport protein (Tim44 family)